MLGKRKRELAVLRRTEDRANESTVLDVPNDGMNDVFRRYFEAKFDPLTESQLTTPSLRDDDSSQQAELMDEDEEEISDSEWSGISEDMTGARIVEVVSHADIAQRTDDDPIGKVFQKSFMTSRIPQSAHHASQPTAIPKAVNEDDAVEEKVNLKHDLDLQRLLRESRLLETTKQNSDGGAQRHKAMDLRLQSLGSRTSLFTQERMPMSHRKGIQAKASSKAAHRHQEARENGIILEKSAKKTSSSASRRERGVDVPVIGKFKGGTLQLSRKDVVSIQGSRAGNKKSRRR